MAYNISYNKKGDIKIIENGEVKDDLDLQWKNNMIDKSIFNNINRSPKILVGERIGISQEEEQEEIPEFENGITEFNVEVEINGSNFISEESQRVLLNPLVTNVESGDIISKDKYSINWYLNGELLDVSDIFELDTSLLNDRENNIIKLEVIINGEVFVDKTSILKYLGFNYSEDDGDNGDGGDVDNGEENPNGEIVYADDGIEIIPLGNGFRTGERILLKYTSKYDELIWGFDDSSTKNGNDVEHVFYEARTHTIKLFGIEDIFNIIDLEAKVRIE